MQECINAEIGRLITAYEFDQVSEEDRCRFEDHLMRCSYCLQELQKMEPLVYNLRENRQAILQALERKGVRFSLPEKPQPDVLVEKQSRTIIKLKKLLEEVRRPVIWIPAAAAALILILALPTRREPNPYAPYLDYSRPAVTHSDLRTTPGARGTESHEAFDAGLAEYLRDNYRQAIQHFQTALRLAPEESEYWLYLGISQFLHHQPKPAVEALTRALPSKDEMIRDTARWYLVQSWLAQQDTVHALPLIEESIRQKGDFARRADSLLVRIRAVIK